MSSSTDQDAKTVDQAVAEGGAYEVLRKRLSEQSGQLTELAKQINAARLEEFGKSEMKIVTRTRVRTENNCIARDIVQVGDLLLFSYNVFIGLKKTTQVEDVFSVFTLDKNGDQFELKAVNQEDTFLSEPRFVKEFNELYHYYKATKLMETRVNNGLLLMCFQISEREEDIRVFRWSISPDGKTLEYIDNRGERDFVLPPAFDFEWKQTTREDTVHGRHSHVNILDTVFVETIGGDLTIKVENNTEDGLGIYREDVDDRTQSIDDAEFFYAEIGSLILLRILPYKEKLYRHFIFNKLTEDVIRIDAIGSSCVQLPEDHGVIFPGGYYLQNGENKTFDDSLKGMMFKRKIKSPNGEDYLYVFYEPVTGTSILLAYNLIEKRLQNPMLCHGYALAADGKIVMFTAEDEATRVHPMQVWQTSFVSDEFASNQVSKQSFFGRIGNASLVRGISDIFSISRAIDKQTVSVKIYEELARQSTKIFDDHYWLGEEQTAGIAALIREISASCELAIDEFEKVQSIKLQSDQALSKAESQQRSFIEELRGSSWTEALDYVEALSRLKHLRGHLATIKELRYINVTKIEALDEELVVSQDELNLRTAEFLSKDEAFAPYSEKVTEIDKSVESVQTNAELNPLLEEMDKLAEGLDLLSEIISTVNVDDANIRTKIVDAITSVYSKLNQSRALAKHKYKTLGSQEAKAQFSAQFKLFSQSLTNGLGLALSPDECDKQMSRLLVQLEDLESQFGEYEEFLSDIIAKREEVYESFESHKQQLLDAQQRKAQNIFDAAERALSSIQRRVNKFKELEDLNTYLASDTLVLKVSEFCKQLHSLDSAVQAEDILSKLKGIKDQGLRLLRDKSDIYEGDGKIIKLGPRHKFSVNTQELDLTILPRQGSLYAHLSGTDFFEKIENAELLELKQYWDVSYISESPAFSRAEYLAASILNDAEFGRELSMASLRESLIDDEKLDALVRAYATPRYKEGYEKGIHDYDAAKIIKQALPALDNADRLKFDPECRGLAYVFWANIEQISSQLEGLRLSCDTWVERAQSAKRLEHTLSSKEACEQLASEIEIALNEFVRLHPIPCSALTIKRCAAYLVAELSGENTPFVCSKYAKELVEELKRTLDEDSWRRLQLALERMFGWPAERWELSRSWVNALIQEKGLEGLQRYVPEAVALINTENRLEYTVSEADLELKIEGLLSEHGRIEERCLVLSLDDFLLRYSNHKNQFIPEYQRFQALRQALIQQERAKLRLEELKPRPLSSFVRNRLINESYLPIIGDNLAKQIGTVGEGKRTDLMGLLMMISPPGYGKTTLMEYVADRLGLIFMKINCPSLGHDVTSLDPAQAPNATAKQELEKLNLSLEMGSNVMLYLDDIQHTHPEFLQKFISLCDGTRRIEGVWQNETRTYDMRGKKFCVVMAGNPYTESGEVFKVPDMLANRADIYNLGDILGGMDEQFALSYIENCLTSNQVLAPLAMRDMKDTYLLFDMAQGKEVATTDLSHQYSGAEIKEVCDVLQKLFVIRDVILKINQQYIDSAAQDDQYRTEPSFKLQGSYRNMNKMAEKVSAVMNDQELQQLIADHYRGESQLLTQGAEENLLKLGEIRGQLSEEENARWLQIKDNFQRSQKMGGKNSDSASQVVAQLVDIGDALGQLQQSLKLGVQLAAKTAQEERKAPSTDSIILGALDGIQAAISSSLEKVEVINQPVPGIDKVLRVLAKTIEESILPIVRSMDKKMEIDLRTHDRMQEVSEQLRGLENQIKQDQLKNKTQVKNKNPQG